jgi:hypothetical protein
MTRSAMARTVQLLTALCVASNASAAAAKPLFDYFQPTPIVGKVAQAPWGASNVQPRDQNNGLEDKTMKNWSYWDGRIVKAADGKYHLFCSRWSQSAGHWNGWPNSLCTHAVSDSSPLGPYIQQGDCYNDAGGKGHNVMAGEITDGTYFIVISETRPFTIYTSKSLDGPWNSLGSIKVTAAAGFKTTNTGSNTTVWPNADGSILATSRDGRMMVSTSGLAGPFTVKTDSVYDASIKYVSGGTPEDACLWYSGGQYHMIYSYPLDRKMYHLTSPDGINNWKDMGLAVDATKPFIKYTDGTANIWNKLERPQVYLEDGHVKYFTFAAIDVDKGNDNGNDTHGSKIIVVPFDGVTFDAETGIDGGGSDAGARDAGGGSGGRGGANGITGGGGNTSGGATGSGGMTARDAGMLTDGGRDAGTLHGRSGQGDTTGSGGAVTTGGQGGVLMTAGAAGASGNDKTTVEPTASSSGCSCSIGARMERAPIGAIVTILGALGLPLTLRRRRR